MQKNKPKIIAIVGPTSSGKSDLAVNLAKKFNGEIISVDSRQVYRGLDIGSGKITKKEMCGVRHHLLDVVSPKKIYTAAQFKKDAEKAILDILKRDRTPILVGGTGFYLSTLLGEISLPEVKPNRILRDSLEELSNKELVSKLEKLDPDRAEEIDPHNTIKIIRAIEIAQTLGKVPRKINNSPYSTLKIGIKVDLSALQERINKRLIFRLKNGMLAESKKLHRNGLSWKRMESLGLEYKYMALHLKREISKNEMTEALKIKIRQYAKRQNTWFKRDNEIKWFKLSENRKIEKVVSDFINE
jgi:tRNA dimethylallyltransferase